MNKKAMRDPDFLNAIIENVDALVVVSDHEGRICRFNATCEKLSGFTFVEVKDKFPWDIFYPRQMSMPCPSISTAGCKLVLSST